MNKSQIKLCHTPPPPKIATNKNLECPWFWLPFLADIVASAAGKIDLKLMMKVRWCGIQGGPLEKTDDAILSSTRDRPVMHLATLCKIHCTF